MTTRDALLPLLQPLLDVVRTVDLKDPAAARAALAERLPLQSDAVTKVRAALRAGVAAGSLCERTAPTPAGVVVKYSRVAKDAGGFSIDAVHMNGPGAGHTHPNGEVDLCFAVDGDPKFDGHDAGWTVYPPGTWHVPTVAGGAMDILYFLPGGAIVFGDKPA